jgi:hypothetical protein
MNGAVEITLDAADVDYARSKARMRTWMNRGRQNPDRNGPLQEGQSGLWGDDVGCVTEMATAFYLGFPWHGEIGNYGASDAGPVQVRGVSVATYRLILHPWDNDDQAFVSALWDGGEKETLRGWLWARDGKRQEYWCDPTGQGRPAFFVPFPYSPMPSLKLLVADARAAKATDWAVRYRQPEAQRHA